MVSNKLKVTVLNGRDLKCKDTIKEITPFCLLQLGSTSHQTRYISSNANPEWNEDFVFDVTSGYEVLLLSIWHKNILRDDVVIGHAFVDCGICKLGEGITITVQLMGIFSGVIHLLVTPLYETMASKIEKMGQKIDLLTYEASKYNCKVNQLNMEINELSENNYRTTTHNNLLEKHKRAVLCENEKLLISKDIISTSRISNNHRILTERDENNIKNKSTPDGEVSSNKDLNKQLINDWERHFSENINLLEDELKKLQGNDKIGCNEQIYHNDVIPHKTTFLNHTESHPSFTTVLQYASIRKPSQQIEINDVVEDGGDGYCDDGCCVYGDGGGDGDGDGEGGGDGDGGDGEDGGDGDGGVYGDGSGDGEDGDVSLVDQSGNRVDHGYGNPIILHNGTKLNEDQLDEIIINQILKVKNEKIINEAKMEILKKVISELDFGINKITGDVSELNGMPTLEKNKMNEESDGNRRK